MRNPDKRMGKGRGFSLMEVMVSVFVLSLGVIGAAALQLSAIRASQQSHFQSNAVQIASEMADKMRANAGQMRLPDQQNPFLRVDYDAGSGTTTSAAASCYASSCNSAQLAAFDIDDLQKRVKAMLPAGRVVICRDAQPWDETARAFRWACDSSGSTGTVFIKIGWRDRVRATAANEDTQPEVAPGVVLPVQPYVE